MMSVWSRTHADLAQLAKTMQARNARTRESLSRRRKSLGNEARVARSRSAGTLSACCSSSSLKENTQGGGEFEYSACATGAYLNQIPQAVVPLDTIVDWIYHSGKDNHDQKRISNQRNDVDDTCEDQLAVHSAGELNNQLTIHQEIAIREYQAVTQENDDLVIYQDRSIHNNDITNTLDSTELCVTSSTVGQGDYKAFTNLKDGFSGDSNQHVSDHIAKSQSSDSPSNDLPSDRPETFLSYRAKTEGIYNDVTIDSRDESPFDTPSITTFYISLPDYEIKENLAEKQSACNDSVTDMRESNSYEESKSTREEKTSNATLANMFFASSGGGSTVPNMVYPHLYVSPHAGETILTFSTKLRVSSTVGQSITEIALSDRPSRCAPCGKCNILEKTGDALGVSQERTYSCDYSFGKEDRLFENPGKCQHILKCSSCQLYPRQISECRNCIVISDRNIIREDTEYQSTISNIHSSGIKKYTPGLRREDDTDSHNFVADAAIDMENCEEDDTRSRNVSLVDSKDMSVRGDDYANRIRVTGNVETDEKCSEDDTHFSNNIRPDLNHSTGSLTSSCQRIFPALKFSGVSIDGHTEEGQKSGSCRQDVGTFYYGDNNANITLLNSGCNSSGSYDTLAYAAEEYPCTSTASRIHSVNVPFEPPVNYTEHLASDISLNTKPCILTSKSLANTKSEYMKFQSRDQFSKSCVHGGESRVNVRTELINQHNYNRFFRHADIPTSVSADTTNAESEGLLDLLSTLRAMVDKLKRGQGVAQCAILLHRLESSKAFAVLEQTPTLFAITDDLKQLCQTLTRRMYHTKPAASAILKKTFIQAPKGHKVSTRQLERCRPWKSVARKANYCRFFKAKYDKCIDVVNKANASQDDNKMGPPEHNQRRRNTVHDKTVFSKDDRLTPKCSVYDSAELKGNPEPSPHQKCYVLDCSSQQPELSSTESAILSNLSSPLSSASDHFSYMESESELGYQLDHEFDKHLADMKPHVLKLPHKTERQKSAVWIKKLCEPVRGGISARKTRNLYAQLMLQMLKKGELGAPFDQKPEPGALKPLPSYLIEKLPDWVEGELAETVGSSIFTKSLGIPAATSTWVSSTADFLERPHTSMGHTLDKDPSLSPIRHTESTQPRYSADDMSIQLQRSPKTSRRHNKEHHSPSGDREKRLLPDVRVKEFRGNGKMNEVTTNEGDWSKPYSTTTSSTFSLPKGTTFYDDPSFLKPADREIDMRAKMIEAKFHEEKLKLQQKHDAAVQKILDRKNSEIEDVKSLYRSKSKDMEDTISKLERKVQTLMKETEFIRQSKDKQISELKKIADDSNETRRNEYEKKLHEVITEFEQEKFELQKQHTQNIQEILDDTNDRLQRMEAEYTNQTNITTDVIKELESRVQQLMNEVDSSLSQRSAVEKEKNDVLMKCEKLSNENERLRERFAQQEKDQLRVIESQEHEIKSLKNKTEASLEYLKQEHSMAASKAADTIRELEEKVDQLKKSLKETEEHRQRQIREMEQNHQQDKVHLENLHDKQIRNLKKELEQLDGEWSKKVSKLEQVVKDKEQEISRVREQKHQQKLQSEQALEDFKSEIERNQNKIYDEMKQQMQQVEVDLQKSKLAREKQAKEFVKQLEDEKYSHQHELAELKMTYEADKSQFMREFHMQKEFLISENERDIENLKELHRTEVLSLEARMKEKQDKAEKSAIDSERAIRELREELLQANQLRKQQLVELGLLREEEKQKMHRDHEAELERVRTEMEQQRLALQRTHSSEMETVLEKTNQRLSTLEKDFTDRTNKSSETITELQGVIKQLRDELQRCKDSYENKIADLRRAHEEAKKAFKKKFSHNLEAVKNELEIQKNRGSNAERRLQKAESDVEERLTELKLHYEEKIRGLVPCDVKKELEDTIVALKSQVNSLQMRSSLLQGELDSRSGLTSFGNLASTAIKSAV